MNSTLQYYKGFLAVVAFGLILTMFIGITNALFIAFVLLVVEFSTIDNAMVNTTVLKGME